ncbi:MAG: esterase-like activity of phytase family protein [Solirubrobacterales bacterium]
MLRTVLNALLGLLLAACLGPEPSAADFVSEPRHLSADDPQREELGEARVLGILELKAPGERRFGGLSGLVLDGDRVTAISDEGHWLRFDLRTDAEGRPLSADGLTVGELGSTDGTKKGGDAEEIVAVPDGYIVSFEQRHRLMLYANGLSAPARPLDPPPGLQRLPRNGGAEAVARLADGRLLVIGEEGGVGNASPAWIGGPGAWQAMTYPRHGDLHPSGAAALPDGGVLVLERGFSLFGGFAIRLVRVAAAELRPGNAIRGREIFQLRPPLLVDNYEGVAVRRRADGRVVAYLISDDNFSPLQATLLMAVLVP